MNTAIVICYSFYDSAYTHYVNINVDGSVKLKILQFEWSHPVVLSEYLLCYNMFPSTQVTFKVSDTSANEDN